MNYCPRRDFTQKVKSRGGTLLTRTYIKESTYSWNIQSYSQYRFARTGAARNRYASTKWLGWHKTQKIPKGLLTISRFCDMNCLVILRYSFALRLVEQLLWKLWTKRHSLSADELIRCEYYILTLSEFARHVRVHRSLIGNLARHSFSFFDRNKTWPQTSKTSEWFNG